MHESQDALRTESESRSHLEMQLRTNLKEYDISARDMARRLGAVEKVSQTDSYMLNKLEEKIRITESQGAGYDKFAVQVKNMVEESLEVDMARIRSALSTLKEGEDVNHEKEKQKESVVLGELGRLGERVGSFEQAYGNENAQHRRRLEVLEQRLYGTEHELKAKEDHHRQVDMSSVNERSGLKDALLTMQGEMKQLQAVVASQVQQKQENSSEMGQVVGALRKSLQNTDNKHTDALGQLFGQLQRELDAIQTTVSKQLTAAKHEQNQRWDGHERGLQTYTQGAAEKMVTIENNLALERENRLAKQMATEKSLDDRVAHLHKLWNKSFMEQSDKVVCQAICMLCICSVLVVSPLLGVTCGNKQSLHLRLCCCLLYACESTLSVFRLMARVDRLLVLYIIPFLLLSIKFLDSQHQHDA
jgi:hypothetical protein